MTVGATRNQKTNQGIRENQKTNQGVRENQKTNQGVRENQKTNQVVREEKSLGTPGLRHGTAEEQELEEITTSLLCVRKQHYLKSGRLMYVLATNSSLL
ncbi:hypothetical protein AVEN_94071-1 [Araneus ventricosus]|uniref:Uncharacterized protein n=1 Tax=Araneus ventricosus TaxID=182803 RepID=A0A4Y2BLS3_ARAVE|nr:hypothetical protein AVEN_7468-1 [Araneus ventricosus]GBL92115.1 hypothetical protein AVEN_22663-1 [Araneus ventricosus]GBL92123.1 hypothetical protein AVEN_55937-1 [Araneus ventricosus]GBL92134.1 hypothetical protein AVEN_94071-1 [Araneus ventricosus]